MNIDKKTTISLGLATAVIVALVTFVASVSADYSTVKAQVRQNTSDIKATKQLISDLNSKLTTTNDHLNTTNTNLVKVNIKLEDLLK